MTPLVVTGASGFLGRALLGHVAPDTPLRVLAHTRMPSAPAGADSTVLRGNLLERETLRALVAPGATVVNLAYLATARAEEDNVAAARNLLEACRAGGAKRLVHCSTAVVAGDATGDLITEQTPCRPATPYEQAKYRVEQVLLERAAGRLEVTVLRPTVVFGPGGRNLVSQARRIARGGIASLLYAGLQGDRRMNLVGVANVAAALAFLVGAGREVDGQVYIVSDDGDPLNNYRDVARILARELGGRRPPGAFSLPPVFLEATLRARGRSNVNPRRRYLDEKLKAAGFRKPQAFEAALVEFAGWARSVLPPADAR